MNKSALAAFAGLLVAGAIAVSAPARADVFSSQSFSGETTTLNNLPGVNLDAAPGAAVNGTCVESEVAAFTVRGGRDGGTMTECRFGNFSLSTTRNRSMARPHDTTYGGNPPPWLQGWRP